LVAGDWLLVAGFSFLVAGVLEMACGNWNLGWYRDDMGEKTKIVLNQ